MVSVEFWSREREKTHESMWKALSDNIAYWKLSYTLAWSECFGFCNRKHMGQATVKRATENKDTHLHLITQMHMQDHIIKKYAA